MLVSFIRLKWLQYSNDDEKPTKNLKQKQRESAASTLHHTKLQKVGKPALSLFLAFQSPSPTISHKQTDIGVTTVAPVRLVGWFDSPTEVTKDLTPFFTFDSHATKPSPIHSCENLDEYIRAIPFNLPTQTPDAPQDEYVPITSQDQVSAAAATPSPPTPEPTL